MNILVTICARGGSKGVKNKNIRELAGRPLIAYAIEIAKKWGKADQIVCSTDSLVIAEIAKKYGAEVPFLRPAELATDHAGKLEVIRHALIESEKIYNTTFEVIFDLDVTNPFRSVDDLNCCLDLFREKSPETITSVVLAKRSPYFNLVELKEDGFAQLSKTLGKEVLRRQDAPPVYEENSAIKVFSRDFLLDKSRKTNLSSQKAAIYVMKKDFAVDIDTEFDFKYIELLFKEGVMDFDQFRS
ncbi:MAG TPA: acylneuraminate cytidylyltransferase family protein [Candidatus Nanoarchaeia archaeon]|nr:acylneuraminate cytidylyltransferase family protein [Candidatus Nanoarchaeia archaeon]